MPARKAPTKPAAAAKIPNEAVRLTEPEPVPQPQAMTIVPYQFRLMPDDVLAVAMRIYHERINNGEAEEHAITNGVSGAKAWTREHGVDYRK